MESNLSLRSFALIILVGLLISSSYLLLNGTSSDTVVVFCNVGQGDGAYLRIKNRIDVLIDAGPDRSILYCLSKFMPQFDKTIEYAFITHPQVDHYGGLIPVLSQYTVKTIYTTGVGSPSQTYDRLERLAQQQGTRIEPFKPGIQIRVENALLSQVWPTQKFLDAITSPARNHDVLTSVYSGDDPNQTSEILRFNQGTMSILFTGDVSPDSVHQMMVSAGCTVKTAQSSRCGFRTPLTVLKVPHHGSKNNMSEELLEIIKPKYGVISSGRKNRFGHPHKETLRLLQDKHVTTYVTARVGSVIFREHNAKWVTTFDPRR